MGELYEAEWCWCHENGANPWELYESPVHDACYFAVMIGEALDDAYGYVDKDKVHRLLEEAEAFGFEVVFDGHFYADEEHPYLCYYRGDVLVAPFPIPEV